MHCGNGRDEKYSEMFENAFSTFVNCEIPYRNWGVHEVCTRVHHPSYHPYYMHISISVCLINYMHHAAYQTTNTKIDDYDYRRSSL